MGRCWFQSLIGKWLNYQSGNLKRNQLGLGLFKSEMIIKKSLKSGDRICWFCILSLGACVLVCLFPHHSSVRNDFKHGSAAWTWGNFCHVNVLCNRSWQSAHNTIGPGFRFLPIQAAQAGVLQWFVRILYNHPPSPYQLLIVEG